MLILPRTKFIIRNKEEISTHEVRYLNNTNQISNDFKVSSHASSDYSMDYIQWMIITGLIHDLDVSKTTEF